MKKMLLILTILTLVVATHASCSPYPGTPVVQAPPEQIAQEVTKPEMSKISEAEPPQMPKQQKASEPSAKQEYPEPETTKFPEPAECAWADWFDNNPDLHKIYAQLISAYLAFENGEPAANIIRGSSIVETHYFFLDDVRGGILLFALHDINGNGTPELIVGFMHRDATEAHHIRVCTVYTLVDYSLIRIIDSRITDERHNINTRSIMHIEGNLIVNTTEYSLSFDGILIEEYSISEGIDCSDHEFGEILQESGKSLNDTPAELNWRRLFEFPEVSTSNHHPTPEPPKWSF